MDEQTKPNKINTSNASVGLRHLLCFTKLLKDSPKSVVLACKYFNLEAYENGITEKASVDYWDFIFQNHYRWLFDFFDEQGIYILIDWYKYENKYQWEFTIAQKRKNRWTVDNQKNRQVTEAKAIKQAFEFLEYKLVKQKT